MSVFYMEGECKSLWWKELWRRYKIIRIIMG